MQREQAEEIIDKIVAVLKEKRVSASISHEKLASKCNLHRSAISLIESRKRKPTLLTCILIADALDVELSKIIEDAMR